MIQRVITHLTIDCWSEDKYFAVQVTTRYCESTVGAGRIEHDVERYTRLTEEEARQVVEDTSEGPWMGDQFVGVQRSLFTPE